MASEWFMLLEVAGALVLGGVVGFERELHHKPAGIRTHMLVAGAACLLTLLGTVVIESFSAQTHTAVSADPIRIIQAIVIGISFLGSGVIFQSENKVRNLTTGASILFTSGIGIAVALNQYVLSLGLAVMVVLTTWLVGYAEDRWIH